ncbi:MAG: DUF6544 family protein [Bacteroidales bacterium]
MNALIITLTIVALVAVILVTADRRFRGKYVEDMINGNNRVRGKRAEILTEEEIVSLPEPLKRYLHYTGVVGKEKPLSARIHFEGWLQEPGKAPFNIRAEQTSYFDIPTRLFFIAGKMMGIPVRAFHRYISASASFEVKPLSLFHVVNERGGSLDYAETVTFFNDMCLIVPGTLAGENIRWEDAGNNTVKGTLTINNISVTAFLTFRENGELVTFWSDDRYFRNDKGEMKKVRWSTPVTDFKEYDGIRLASGAEAIWSFPEGDFRYASFILRDVKVNF